jgi:hypothetical protein
LLRFKFQFKSLKLSSDPTLKEFGIKVSETMTEVAGRVLAPPALEYSGQKEVRVQNGVWRADRMQFQRAGNTISSWGIIDLSNSRGGME